MRNLQFPLILALCTVILLAGSPTHACPFCAATSPTICEELAEVDVVVIARLVAIVPPDKLLAKTGSLDSKVARFEVVDVLRGGSAVRGVRQIDVPGASENNVGSLRLLMGCGAPKLTWSELHRLSPRGREYVKQAIALPAEGVERLAFFYTYLEDAEEQIAQDAYNEFANASYAAVRQLRDKMDRQRLVERVADPKTPAARKGLLFTMLGICGTADEAALLDELVRKGSRANPGSFDAILAAYLSLRGEAALDSLDTLFLRVSDSSDRQPEAADSHAAIRALRFHLEEQHGVSKKRILESLRLLLDRPELATVVIADLARWEDWQALPKLVELFKAAEKDASGLRVQVVNYLLTCPLPEASRQLEELARLAPRDVERARILSVYGKRSGAPPVPD